MSILAPRLSPSHSSISQSSQRRSDDLTRGAGEENPALPELGEIIGRTTPGSSGEDAAPASAAPAELDPWRVDVFSFHDQTSGLSRNAFRLQPALKVQPVILSEAKDLLS
jgi:hypothetical protein